MRMIQGGPKKNPSHRRRPLTDERDAFARLFAKAASADTERGADELAITYSWNGYVTCRRVLVRGGSLNFSGLRAAHSGPVEGTGSPIQAAARPFTSLVSDFRTSVCSPGSSAYNGCKVQT